MTNSQEMLDMSLNNGQYCSDRVIEVLRNYASASRTALRLYSTPSNSPLKNTIAKYHGVSPENVLLGNGSGPLLSQMTVTILENKAKEAASSGLENTFSMVFSEFTYFKMPLLMQKNKVPLRIVPMDVNNNFKLRLDLLEEMLTKQDSMVYLVNPNNPTGNLIISKDELEALLVKFPRSVFFIDEAYFRFVEPTLDSSKAILIKKYNNLLVSCSFSFAYGLAGARIGYVIASPELVRTAESKVTAYTIGKLQEDIAIASLEDTDHMVYVRKVTAVEREKVMQVLRSRCDNLIQVFDPPCLTNYILCRFKNPSISAEGLRINLERNHKILIKSFERLPSIHPLDSYFRITLCLPHENDRFLSVFPDCVRNYVSNLKLTSRM